MHRREVGPRCSAGELGYIEATQKEISSIEPDERLIPDEETYVDGEAFDDTTKTIE